MIFFSQIALSMAIVKERRVNAIMVLRKLATNAGKVSLSENILVIFVLECLPFSFQTLAGIVKLSCSIPTSNLSFFSYFRRMSDK